MVALTAELGEPPERILDLWRLDALRGIAFDGDAVSLGALTTYTDIRRSALCREHLPVLVEAAATIGAARIQNRGTIGGNAVNASPAGDTLPVLLAADATFVVGSVRGERTVAAAAFWPAYRQTALAPDELLLRILIPLRAGRELRYRKVGTRRAQSISKVVMALGWRDGMPATPWTDVRPLRSGGRRHADPCPCHRGGPRRPLADARDGRSRGRDAGGRARPDRRCPLDRGVPATGCRPGPPSPGPRGGRLVMTADRRSLAIDDLDVIAPGAFAAAVAPLFEGARRVPRPPGDGAPIRVGRGDVRARPRDRADDAAR